MLNGLFLYSTLWVQLTTLFYTTSQMYSFTHTHTHLHSVAEYTFLLYHTLMDISKATSCLGQWFPTGGSVADPFSMGGLCLSKKKVQKNAHALILKGSECMLFTLLNSRWRRYPVMLIDSRHFTDMRVTMAKRRYDIDYIKYGFSYIEDKRGERPQSTFWFWIKMQPLEC